MDWPVTHSCGDTGIWPWPTPKTRGDTRRLDAHLAYLRTQPCRKCSSRADNAVDEWDTTACDCHGYPCCYCLRCYPEHLTQEQELPLYLALYRAAGIEIPA